MPTDANQASPSSRPPFREELAGTWRRLDQKGIFFTLLAAWVVLFHFFGNSTFGYIHSPSLFAWLSNSYNAPASEDGHGNLIPLVVLVLFWLRRELLLALPQKTSWSGFVVVAFALLLHSAGFLLQQQRLSAIGFFLGLLGLIGLCWGVQWMRASIFPMVLFAFSIPITSLIDGATLPLRIAATTITYGVAHGLFGVPLAQMGTQLFSPDGRFTYDVAAACSGIRSLVSLLALTTIYSMVVLQRPGHRLLMIASTFPLALACNVLRLSTVVLATEAMGSRVGLLVHEWFGFVTYAVALAVVYWLGRQLRSKGNQSVAREAIA